jgi:transitional endoplasmic reticulum ATPase
MSSDFGIEHDEAHSPRSHDETTKRFFAHSSAKRISTDTVILKALKKQYPGYEVLVVPDAGVSGMAVTSVNLLGYASSGRASFTPIEDAGEGLPSNIVWKNYLEPARRLNGSMGVLADSINFGKFLYHWQGSDFVLYLVDGRDGSSSYPKLMNYYIVTAEPSKAEALILAAGKWSSDLHDEVWVWDKSYWQKSKELYQSVAKSSWDNVILDAGMKKAIIEDHLSFFSSRDTYEGLKIPWKRGLIFHGPPGNGKTISIKAMMHMLAGLKNPVPTLYVRNFVSVSPHK